MAAHVSEIPTDEMGSYPALLGVAPVTTGQRVGVRLLEGIIGGLVLGGASLFSIVLTPIFYVIVVSGFVLTELIVVLTAGATFGHLVLGLRHVSVRTGQVAGGATLLKYFLENVIGVITLGLGFLIPVLTIKAPLQRNWFDRTVGVMVVNRRRLVNRPADSSARIAVTDDSRAATSWWSQGTMGQGPGDHGLLGAPPPVGHTLAAAMADAPRVGAPADLDAGQTITAGGLRPRSDRGSDDLPATVQLDNGVTFTLDGPCILGRTPSARPGLEDARLVSVPDKEMSLSKTHLAIGPTPGGAWAMDLHSTNGVRLIRPSGETTTLPRGQRQEIPLGSRLEYGLRTLSVSKL